MSDDEQEEEVELSRQDYDLIKNLTRGQLIIFHEEKDGSMCRDSEGTGLLREALMSSLLDGSVDIDDVRSCMDEIDEAERHIAKVLSPFEKACLKAEAF